MMLLLLVAISLVFNVSSFPLTAPRKSLSVRLNMAISFDSWGSQKVDDVPMEAPTLRPSSSPESASIGVRRKPAYNAGLDERFPQFPTEKSLEKEYEKVANLDVNMRQRTLLMGLQGNQWGEAEKLMRIEVASLDGGILPSSSAYSVQSANLEAGGLLEDWNFNIQ